MYESSVPPSTGPEGPLRPSNGSEVEGHKVYYLYILCDIKNRLYTGVTSDISKRITYHSQKRGSNFTKNSKSLKLVFQEEYTSLAKARQREIQIKKWRRDKKEMLITRFENNLPTQVT